MSTQVRYHRACHDNKRRQRGRTHTRAEMRKNHFSFNMQIEMAGSFADERGIRAQLYLNGLDVTARSGHGFSSDRVWGEISLQFPPNRKKRASPIHSTRPILYNIYIITSFVFCFSCFFSFNTLCEVHERMQPDRQRALLRQQRVVNFGPKDASLHTSVLPR